MRLEKIIDDLIKLKSSKIKTKNYIKKLWKNDTIEELLLLIDFNINIDNTNLHIPVFEDAEDNASIIKFNDFYVLINILKNTIDIKDKEKLIEDFALECNEIIWNKIYQVVLKKELSSIINLEEIVETLKSLTENTK